MADRFRLGWFGNLTAPEWRDGWSEDARTWTDGRFYVDMVRAMERAGFDFMMLEDSLMVPDIYAGTAELELKHAMYAPKLDPVPVVSMLAYATEHIGIAVDTDKGLLVPLIRDAGDLSLAGIAKKIGDLAARTRASKVSPDELSGGSAGTSSPPARTGRPRTLAWTSFRSTTRGMRLPRSSSMSSMPCGNPGSRTPSWPTPSPGTTPTTPRSRRSTIAASTSPSAVR